MNIERNLGRQPLADLLDRLQLKSHDLVVHSNDFLTHKMVSRALKGRRLTLNTQKKVLNALIKASGRNFHLNELFTYR